MKFWKDLWNDESGVATEYVVLTAFIAIALIGTCLWFSDEIGTFIKTKIIDPLFNPPGPQEPSDS